MRFCKLGKFRNILFQIKGDRGEWALNVKHDSGLEFLFFYNGYYLGNYKSDGCVLMFFFFLILRDAL